MGWDFKLLCEQKPEVAEAMRTLGNASPTVNRSDKTIKGWMRDEDGDTCKAYFTSSDLVRISDGLLEVAKWLDSRSMSDEPDIYR